MVWFIFVVVFFKEAVCQFGLEPRFGKNGFSGGISEFYAIRTTDKAPAAFGKYAPAPEDLYDLENKITKAGKWPEFIAKVQDTGSKVRGEVMEDWENDALKWAAWINGLKDPANHGKSVQRQQPPLVKYEESSEEKPTLGMEMYWEDKKPKAPPPALRSGPEYGNGPPGYPGAGQNYEPPGPNGQSGYPGLGQNYGHPGPNRQERPSGYPSAGQNYGPPGLPAQVLPPGLGQGYGPPPLPPSRLPTQLSADSVMMMAQKRVQELEKQQQYIPPNLDGTPTGRENETPSFKQNPNDGKEPGEGEFIQFAFSKLHQIEDMLHKREMERNKTNIGDPISKLPKFDDFEAPIRWVPFNSDDTSEGIAKVTDIKTGKNVQATIDGTIYVPVIDYDVTKIGFSVSTEPTTLFPKILAIYDKTTETSVLRTVMDNVDMKQPDQRDWLAFETIMGGNRNQLKCGGSKCQSRCRSVGCQTMCDGEFCGSGCVGVTCNSMCRGDQCSSMCIGEGCIARCEGLSCDARCRGKNCVANCHKASCVATINGDAKISQTNWYEQYAQNPNKEK